MIFDRCYTLDWFSTKTLFTAHYIRWNRSSVSYTKRHHQNEQQIQKLAKSIWFFWSHRFLSFLAIYCYLDCSYSDATAFSMNKRGEIFLSKNKKHKKYFVQWDSKGTRYVDSFSCWRNGLIFPFPIFLLHNMCRFGYFRWFPKMKKWRSVSTFYQYNKKKNIRNLNIRYFESHR